MLYSTAVIERKTHRKAILTRLKQFPVVSSGVRVRGCSGNPQRRSPAE